MLKIEENDIKVLKSIIESYQELNDLIYDLSKQINEISLKKQAASEKLELLKATESNFIDFIKKKYNCEFTTDDLFKIIMETSNIDYESSNMCNSQI